MRTVAIVQARMGSTRLPGKVMRPVCGVPVIDLLLGRLAAARTVDAIVLATTDSPADDDFARHVAALGHAVFRGSEDDVLDRYYHAAAAQHADVVVRITGDCPLVDPVLVDDIVAAFHAANVDYLGNTEPPTFPDGLDVEVFSFAALERAWREADSPFEREHVTPYLTGNLQFTRGAFGSGAELASMRWTLDDPEDLTVITAVFEHFHPRRDFGWREVLALAAAQPELFDANQHVRRNEGALLATGQKLWKRARRVIPGGSMLLSKRPEMFLPDHWPAYFSRAAGCRVWDLDGREFIDMSLMGVGTNTLGYAHAEVDAAVRAAVDAGNMSTLNCPEEVMLAERLVEMHPWADMVRLARTGGEANAIAIRIARAAAGREKVAICGYHGWHDWYLSANLGNDETLAGHLLPGLEPNGVPPQLRGTALAFRYNEFEELLALLDRHPDIGVIKMEVQRSEPPRDRFLERVRELATARGVVLVFDECTSGFRQTFGGLHRQYGVEPDIAVFSKALGNGYAISAVAGRRSVMEAAQTTFISSTFWTERIGPSAALATLDVMERTRSWDVITAIGHRVQAGWRELAVRHGLDVRVAGLPALATFSFAGPRALEYKTLVSQEMLRQGYLAGTALYVCTLHEPELAAYFDALDRVFALVRECEDGRDVADLLEGPVCHAGFHRLN
ncbi:MAG TPA: aminotransferase class III-fold pyridoxal phosphate-dependent enzyme [Longimicrobiales bacterium]|nr:aminotransferase class III-fold pyridoxal phosphate-dependent enzyme [Longimicrobiales bacterium]